MLVKFLLLALAANLISAAPLASSNATKSNPKVLILGGGVTGVIAARQLSDAGIDFQIIEARHEIGGRLQHFQFGGKNGSQSVQLEAGANWVQGTQEDGGLANPIWTLAKKWNVTTVDNDWSDIALFNASGLANYTDTFQASVDAYTNLTIGAGARVQTNTADLTARSGYRYLGWKPRTPEEMASEYYQFDWEYANTPIETSWIASSYGNNFTYDSSVGGFGGDNLMCIDQQDGFRGFIAKEFASFGKSSQVRYNSTVTNVKYSEDGVTVVLADGSTISGDYALVTFSLGVLQHDDVKWSPPLPDWKTEAIASMQMAIYTKIFMQFPEKFWPDNEMGLWADPNQRGRYPVWQSLDHEGFFPGSNIYFVTVTGDYSEYVESLSDDAVKEEVMGVLAKMFPDITVPEPLDFYFPRWFSNPLFRGSYSNWPPSFYSQHLENLKGTVNDRLYFAGEHTSYKWFGFLGGAYFEGRAAGDSIAGAIKNKQNVQEFTHVDAVKACYQFEPMGFSSD